MKPIIQRDKGEGKNPVPREVVVGAETIAKLDAIEDYEGDDYDAALMALAGFDVTTLREFLEKTGRIKDPAAQSLLQRFEQQASVQASVQFRAGYA